MRRARRQSMCRYCYGVGHTRRTCPQVKEIIKQNPNSYLAETQKRHCSYCRQEGHTKVKCVQYAEKKRQHNIQILETRSNICTALTELGIAPGALVRTEMYVRNPVNGKSWVVAPAIVNRVLWEKVVKVYEDGLEVINPIDGGTTTVRFPKHQVMGENYSDTVMLSPASKEYAKQYNENGMYSNNDKVLKERGYSK